MAATERVSTPIGRYVTLASNARLEMEADQLDLSGRYIEVPSVPPGVLAVVTVKGHRLASLELAAYGRETWSGEESGRKIV